jgi:hypothetical protein
MTKPNTTQKRKLIDLVQACDLDAPQPVELEIWNTLEPKGREYDSDDAERDAE